MKRTLLTFDHGLGDAAMFTSVLRNLQRRDEVIDVLSLTGKHSCFHGLCRKSLSAPTRSDLNRMAEELLATGDYHRRIHIDWPENYGDHRGTEPATKAEKCLREVFGIAPDPGLWGYSIAVSDEARTSAAEFLSEHSETVGDRFRCGILHYQGNTSADKKDLTQTEAEFICRALRDRGLVPLLLDFESPPRSPLVGREGILTPRIEHPLWKGTGTGDGELIAALIDLSMVCIAVDSGPGHLAAATSTPTLMIWRGHHPLHFYCPADNVTHLLPTDHRTLLHGDRSLGERFFLLNYRCEDRDPFGERVESWLDQHAGPASKKSEDVAAGELVERSGICVRRRYLEQDLVIVRDVLERDCYRVGDFPLFPAPDGIEYVVDIGAHVGCFAERWKRRNNLARIACVEPSPSNFSVLRHNVRGSLFLAACTYRPDQVFDDGVFPGTLSTGGGTLRDKANPARLDLKRRGPVAAITLEEILEWTGFPRIDCLKLDCEGSEFDILLGCAAKTLSKIRWIVGEAHDRGRFLREIVHGRLVDWRHDVIGQSRQSPQLYNFRLTNPLYERTDHH